MGKPTFLVGKGAGKGSLTTSALDEHYRRVFRGLAQWDNLPDGAPSNFPQDCVFFTGGCGCKRMKGIGPVMAGVSPSTLTVYATPYEWIPRPIGMAMDLQSEFFEPTNDPCLWVGQPVLDLIRPYLELMDRTLKTINQNVLALSQPIAFKGIPGAELPAVAMRNSILDGDVSIPSTGAGFNAEVLDLKAQDHTANLISAVDWCDARILEIMMSSNGVEKSSGITTLETVSGVQSIMQEFDDYMARCRDFCDRVNDKFRIDLSVKPGKGIESLMQRPADTRETIREGEQDAE